MQTSNSPRFEHLEKLLRDLFGVRETDVLHLAKADPIHCQRLELAAQRVITLAPDVEHFDGLAVGTKPDDVCPSLACDVRVEAAAKTTLGRHHQEQMNIVLAGTDQQRRRTFLARKSLVEVREDGIHPLRIRPRSGRRFLGTAKLRRRHHLHRLGDFARSFHRGDTISQILEAGHPCLPGSPSGSSPAQAAKPLENLSRNSTSFVSVSDETSRSVRIVSRMSLP